MLTQLCTYVNKVIFPFIVSFSRNNFSILIRNAYVICFHLPNFQHVAPPTCLVVYKPRSIARSLF